MKKVMLVLSISGTPQEVIDYAVSRAKKEGVGLIALYILETGLSESVFDSFSDVGFIGDKPSTELSEAVMKEYRQRSYEELGRVQIKAMEEAVDFEPLTEQGEYVDKALEVIRLRGIGVAVLLRRQKRRFMKYLSSSVADEVKSQAPCEVVIFTEND